MLRTSSKKNFRLFVKQDMGMGAKKQVAGEWDTALLSISVSTRKQCFLILEQRFWGEIIKILACLESRPCACFQGALWWLYKYKDEKNQKNKEPVQVVMRWP